MAAIATPALAQGGLGGVLFSGEARDDRRAPPPSVARYVAEDGAGFILDRSTTPPLLKFDESVEVLVLKPSPAARGDVIYRDELGAPVLRMTRLGGVTLFAKGRPEGAPVAVAGEAASLRLTRVTPSALLQRLAEASLRTSRATRRLIVFEAEDVTPASAPLIADAVSVTAEAVVIMARRKDGGTMLGRFDRVRFTPGEKSVVTIQNRTMKIVVNAEEGLAGRPSSARIIQVASRGK